jgi:hypothetical protein
MSDADTMSSRDYEREASASRKRLAGSLRELTDRLTPGQVMDEMLTYAKGGGGTFMSALSNATRENPMPSLLIGAGLLMFLSEKTGLVNLMRGDHATARRADGRGSAADGGYGGTAYDTATRAYAGDGRRNGMRNAMSGMANAGAGMAQSVASTVRGATDQAMASAGTIADGARAAAGNLGSSIASASAGVAEAGAGVASSVAGTADHLMHRAHDFGDALGDTSAAVAGHLAETARGAPRKITNTAMQARDSLLSLVGEQPLAAGALGLAIGAVIAAALPKTEAEDEFMGEVSDSVKSAVGDLANQEMHAAQSVASRLVSEVDKVAGEVLKVAEEEGVSPAGAAKAVRDTADRIVGDSGADTANPGAEGS